MASSSNVLCGPCEAQYITKSAEHWCPECEEGLCIDCQKHHSFSKVSRSHGIISVENYKKLPNRISAVVHYCKEHNMRHQNYCSQHDQICCPVCISTNHKKCTDLMAIPDLIKTSKASSLLVNMEQSLLDIKNNIDKVIRNSKENLSTIQDQRNKFIDDVKQMRFKINSHLDMLEQKMINELLAAERKAKEQIEQSLTQISKSGNEVDELKNDVFAIKEYASDLQTFYGCKAMEAEVVKIEKYMTSLQEDVDLHELNLKCIIDKKLSNMFSYFTTFGSVSLATSPSSVVLKTEKEKQAQILTVIQQPPPNTAQDIKLSLAFSFTMPEALHKTTVRGCAIGPNGKIIFTDRGKNSRIIIHSDDSLVKVVHFNGPELYDVTTITDTKFAVSTCDGILIFNTDGGLIDKCIQTGCMGCGITHHKEQLLWCEKSIGVLASHLSADRTTILFTDKTLPGWSYIAACDDNIYTTNPETGAVTCYQKNKKLWEFQNVDILRDPAGVTVDNQHNVYVTSFKDSKVVVISPDGQQERTLLAYKDGIVKPFGICFDKVRNKLVVANQDGTVHVYNIS